jgi:hypothetical protein
MATFIRSARQEEMEIDIFQIKYIPYITEIGSVNYLEESCLFITDVVPRDFSRIKVQNIEATHNCTVPDQSMWD